MNNNNNSKNNQVKKVTKDKTMVHMIPFLDHRSFPEKKIRSKNCLKQNKKKTNNKINKTTKKIQMTRNLRLRACFGVQN